MKIACSTSAFKIPLNDALKQISEMGFKYVDIIAIPAWNHLSFEKMQDDYDTYLTEIKSALKTNNLTPIATNFAVAHPHTRDKETNIKRINEVKVLVKFMKDLDIEKGSFYPGYKNEERDWNDVLEDSILSFNEIIEIGKEQGICLAPELHTGTPFETIEQIEKLFNKMPELEIVYDPSHFAIKEIDLQNTKFILDKAVHVHLRDADKDQLQSHFGTGNVDFNWILETLKKQNYKGDISIEYLPDNKDNKDNFNDDIMKTKNFLFNYI